MWSTHQFDSRDLSNEFFVFGEWRKMWVTLLLGRILVLALSFSLQYKIVWRLSSVKMTILPVCAHFIATFSIFRCRRRHRFASFTQITFSYFIRLESRCKVWWVLQLLLLHTYIRSRALKVYCLFARCTLCEWPIVINKTFLCVFKRPYSPFLFITNMYAMHI